MRKMVDLPPVWLAVFVALVWVQARRLPFGPDGGALTDLLGGVLVGAGFLLMAMAVVAMRQAATTVMPHQTPQALVTTGIFARTRNPIYLGDVCVLVGLALFWGAWSVLLLAPLFAWVITDRFILDEEARLRDSFPDQADAYFLRVRRWI